MTAGNMRDNQKVLGISMEPLWREPYQVTIEVENRQCRILRMLDSYGIQQFKVTDIRGSSVGSANHLVELSPDQVEKIPRKRLQKMWKSARPEGKTSVWFESQGCDVCNTILAHGSFPVSGKSLPTSTFAYSFIAPSFDAYKSIMSVLENGNLKVKVLRVGKFESKREILTEKQERIFWLALKVGFFDYPRKVDTIELSRRLGISPGTLSEITRRGLRRLLEHYFGT